MTPVTGIVRITIMAYQWFDAHTFYGPEYVSHFCSSYLLNELPLRHLVTLKGSHFPEYQGSLKYCLLLVAHPFPQRPSRPCSSIRAFS